MRVQNASVLSRVLRAAAAVVLAGGVGVVAAPAASAHAVLRSTSPRAGEVLTSAPAQVVVTFDDTVTAPGFLTVTGPGGRVDAGPAQVAGDHVSVPLEAGAASGVYAVAYRVVSDDGHPVQGTFGFTLRLAGGAASSASTTPAGAVPSASAASPGPGRADAFAAPAATAASKDDGHAQHWFAGVAGGAMVVAGAGALLWGRRQRGRRGAAGARS